MSYIYHSNTVVSIIRKFYYHYSLTRRGSGVRITDSAETFGCVFGYRNIKKAAILDPNAKKTEVLGTFSFILKKVLKNPFLKMTTA